MDRNLLKILSLFFDATIPKLKGLSNEESLKRF